MYRTWTTADLVAELQEIAREMLIADRGDLAGMFARYSRVEQELTTRGWRETEAARVAA